MTHCASMIAGGLLAACLLMGQAAAQTSPAQTSPTATIDTGVLRGVATNGVDAFKGVPFAAPPVGSLRWRAPQPAAAWTGVRPAEAYGHDCMQVPFPSDAAPLGTPPSEDCLYLNVWKPAGAATGLPVMVWIYGGGFVNGGASPPTYSGAELAKDGVVVVSFNYRVGRFGTFAHPALTRENPDDGLLANYGFLDQIAALNWVRRNIAAFGGNPEAVTVIGESAGGMSVHTLLTSPLSQGLFQKAVIQSGGAGGMGPATVATAETAGLAFAARHDIAAEDPAALGKLRALSAEQVTDGLNMSALFAPAAGPRTFSSPVIDGRIAVDPAQAYEAGRFAHIPIMIGATSDDIGGPDGFMIAGARQMADRISAQGAPVHYYRFSYVADSARTPETRGAAHATEIPFFFRTVEAKYGDQTTARDRAAGAVAGGYLLNFVKTGDPNGAGLPEWRAVSPEARTMMDFDRAGGATSLVEP